ncbi:MAG TPA: deoxyribodipyrimidine photo-lyase [Bacteroidales bacterium]|nr:deoxyribodipyrimidine photo-lyase [Bacteroidales bacterium]
MSKKKITFFWFRRDLRVDDNTALFHALKEKENVLPLFIFDKNILEELNNAADPRVEFIYNKIIQLKKWFESEGSSLLIKYNTPQKVFEELTNDYHIEAIYANRDYEPYGRERDEKVKNLLSEKEIDFHTYKDHVLMETNQVLKKDGTPYTVFSPYGKMWRKVITDDAFKSYDSGGHFSSLYSCKPFGNISLEDMGFKKTGYAIPSDQVQNEIIVEYDKKRNLPAENGTSRLGIHLRFGTISIRKLARKARLLNDTFLNELIWRDFFMMILWHFPHVVDKAFKPAYDLIEWRNDEKDFEAWCQGKTGYPIVDAGMRELNETGFMHNRVRMITASFLTKHLLIDWRWGERYFAEKLLDFELSSNNGGWQWAAGSGCDATPYFRVFNPELQTKKFDPKLKYTRKWVPEIDDFGYPEPVVEHKFARERVLHTYKTALEKAKK